LNEQLDLEEYLNIPNLIIIIIIFVVNKN